MTANVSVAVIDNVEMDGDEEDAMLEEIQVSSLDHASAIFQTRDDGLIIFV